MKKTPALANRLAGFKSSSIDDFNVDHCKNCRLTWFDGGELAKLQLSYERSPRGRDSKQHYVNYSEISPEEQAKYRRTIAESIRSTGDALGKGFMGALAEMAHRISSRNRS